MKRFIAGIAAIVLSVSSLGLPDTAFVANAETIHTIDLYGINHSFWDGILEIPDNFEIEFQIPDFETTGGWHLDTTDSVEYCPIILSDTGLVTLRDFTDSSYYENTASVTNGSDTYVFNTHDYSEYRCEEIADEIIANNTNDSMSTYDKVRNILKYISVHYRYKSRGSAGYEMLITGNGNCYGAASCVVFICRRMGIQARGRDASNDSGAGSNHANNEINIDGTTYYADCSDLDGSYLFTKACEYPRLERKTCGNFEYKIMADGTAMLTHYFGFNESVINLPAYDGDTPITSVDFKIFNGSGDSITELSVPATYTQLYDDCFFGCKNLKKVTLAPELTSLPERCFDDCDSLTDINLENITDFGAYCLAGTEITSIGNQIVKSINDGSFTATNITSINLSDDLTSIPDAAFCGCANLLNLNLSTNVTYIGRSAFYHCSSLELTIPDSVTTIGKDALLGVKTVYCSLNSYAAQYCKENNIRFICPEINDLSLGTAEISYTTIAGGGKDNTPMVRWVKNVGGERLVEGTDYTVSYEDNCNVGEGKVVITGIGQYYGSFKKAFTITPTVLNSSIAPYLKVSTAHYNAGLPVEPTVTSDIMTEGKDFTISYANNTEVGMATATLTITGMGNFTGSYTRDFAIYACDIGKDYAKMTSEVSDCVFNGTPVIPKYELYSHGIKLIEGKDYEAKVLCNNRIGTGVVSFSGIGGYTGSTYKTFKITAPVETTTTPAVTTAPAETTTTPAVTTAPVETTTTPAVTTAPAETTTTPAVTTTPVKTTTTPAETTKATTTTKNTTAVTTAPTAPTVTTSAVTTKVTTTPVTTTTTTTKKTTTAVTTAPVTTTTAETTKVTTTEPEPEPVFADNDINLATISNPMTQSCIGVELKPLISVRLDGKNLLKGRDYTVAYKNNVNVGTATMTITGKGKYVGTVEKTFTIKTRSSTNVKNPNVIGRQTTPYAAVITWVPDFTVNGAEAMYSYNSDLSNSKTVTVEGYGQNFAAINSLKGDNVNGYDNSKKLYVKVRSFIYVDGKKKYGDWSTVRTINEKK